MMVSFDVFFCSLLFFHANLFVATRIHAAAACIRRVALAQQSTTRQVGNSGQPPSKQTEHAPLATAAAAETERASSSPPTWVKALVWFWLIDETLSANLVYKSGHEIGSTLQVVKQMKIMT